MKKRLALPSTVVLAAVATFGLSACSLDDTATTSDMCAYTQGDGSGGNDARVHEIFYPNQEVTKDSDENAYFFPCNQRNLRFTPGSTDVDAQGRPVSYIDARTSSGVPVKVEMTAYWTLNEDQTVLRNVTIPLMAKYNAATGDPSVRNANFSSNGWSRGLLGEIFTPKLQSTVRDVIGTKGNEVWQDASQKQAIAQAVSTEFMTNVKAATGSTSDVFCASGESSGWSNPAEPGKGAYNCGNVRIDVTRIIPTDTTLLEMNARKAEADEVAAANKAELDAAKKKYGPDAGKYLAQLDVIKACKAAGMKVCSMGNDGGVTVSVGGGTK